MNENERKDEDGDERVINDGDGDERGKCKVEKKE